MTNNPIKGELLFSESVYVDEPYFEHPSDDMYKLYRYQNDRSMKEMRKDLFIFHRKCKYKKEEDVINAFYAQKNNMKQFNIKLKEKFLKKKKIRFCTLLKYIIEEEIYKIPKEFKITLIDGRYITYEENDISFLFIGIDGNYYYFEYMGSNL